MSTKLLSLFVGVCCCIASNGFATVIVNDPAPIDYQLTVNVIQTAFDNGSGPATMFGDATSQAYIFNEIDRVWSQAGIDVEFIMPSSTYDNTFALEGTSPDPPATRPMSDLNTIVNQANTNGVLHPDPNVLNMFLVDITPGFERLDENYVAGLAYLDANGITLFVGENLLGGSGGRDLVAEVTAHEIGHNLGLGHFEDPPLVLVTQLT